MLLFLSSLLWWSCAQESRPQGGPRDEAPPVIDESRSTDNYQVHFDEKNIRLAFDEFVTIDKPVQSVIISPPMSRNPRIYARGKEIRIEIPDEETLKPDATYLINFGESIRDFTESNKLKNYSFIFSTGAYIDSLTVSGRVVSAFDKEPVEDVLVMLYDTFPDSIVYEQRPFYFASTEKDGSFIINNVRADTFKVFALKDENVNYLNDLDNELIGFLDSLIVVSDDSTSLSYELEVFLPEQAYALKEYDAKTYGKIDFLFTQSPQNVVVTNSLDRGDFYAEVSGDSLVYWYQLERDTSFKVYIQDSSFIVDTINIRKLSSSKFRQENSLKVLNTNLEPKDLLRPNTALSVQYNFPLVEIDESAFRLEQDSMELTGYMVSIDSIRPSRVLVSYPYLPDSAYTLTLDSAALISLHGLASDSLSLSFQTSNMANYGSITLNYDSLDIMQDYVVYLQQGERQIEKRIIQNSQEGSLSFEQLLPGEYNFEFIRDENKNGRWDPGVYLSKTFSEEIIRVKTEAVKPSWEIEATFYGFEK